MTNVEILSVALVLAGLYITYQTYLISRYKRVLRMAQYAMQGLLLDLITGEKDEEPTDD